MTSLNKSLAGPNAIFLNIILAIIAFILIIYLRNMYVTIIAVVIVVGVYFVFDTKALFQINDDPATPYIESQPIDDSVEGSETGSIVPFIRSLENVEAENVEAEETIGCSGINLNDPNVVTIGSYEDFATNSAYATDSSKIFVLTNDIDFTDSPQIDGSVYPVFNASFEGNCFSIKNFTITNTSGGNTVGFFGKVDATDSPIYIKNVTFEDFAFNIQNHSIYIGIFGIVQSSITSPSEDVTFENVTVHLNKASLITINSDYTYFYFGGLIGRCHNSKLLDCNLILSHRIDLYLTTDNFKNLTFGAICGNARNMSMMACSANLIGSDIILNTPGNSLTFGLLCGRTWSDKTAYLNFLNNTMILKDSTLKTNYTLNENQYGYVIGYRTGKPIVSAKNNTVMSFVDGLYFGSDGQLTGNNINEEENNKINNLSSASPSDISIKDQIYGMKLDEDNTYWKKVYYIYYEGNTSNMSCRYYDVFNFWKNTELGTYCLEDDMCNTNMYGTCDSGDGRRGWTQFGGNLSVECGNNGQITYTLLTDIAFSSYEAIILDDGVTFDGNNKTITFNGTNWYGLFTFTKKDYKINVNIRNINLNLGGGNIKGFHGGIISNSRFSPGDFANYDMNIENCNVTNGNIGSYSGGIVGSYFCANSDSTGTIHGCSNNCSFVGNRSGGISGYATSHYGKLKITNSWNKADISTNRSGGICGSNSGRKGQLEIINCWNEGSLANGTENGGIIGYHSSSDNLNTHVFIFNCYNTGDIGTSSGGICATSDSNGTRLMILNCYSTCEIKDLDNTSYTFGGIVAASNSTFQPYVLYCDVYLTNTEASYDSKYNENKIVSRNNYRTEYESINSLGSPYDEKYHTMNFNLTSLKNLIDTIPYDFISPVWDTDNLSIPDSDSSSN